MVHPERFSLVLNQMVLWHRLTGLISLIDVAQDYAKSYGDEQAVVLCCVMSEHEFEANMQVAQCLLDDDEIDSLPECDNLLFSLEYLEGVVSQNTIRDFTVIARAL